MTDNERLAMRMTITSIENADVLRIDKLREALLEVARIAGEVGNERDQRIREVIREAVDAWLR